MTLRVGLLAGLLGLALAGCTTHQNNGDATAASPSWYPVVNERGDPVSAVYQSRVPCLDERARATPGCERVKLALALYRDRRTGAPTTYLMARVYVGGGDERIEDRGVWTVGAGAARDARAQVYELDSNAPRDFRAFWAISDDVIFVLDRDRQPRVGNAGYGYALNRTS